MNTAAEQSVLTRGTTANRNLDDILFGFYAQASQAQSLETLAECFEKSIAKAIRLADTAFQSPELPKQTSIEKSSPRRPSWPTATWCFYCPTGIDRTARLETFFRGQLLSAHNLSSSEFLPQALASFLTGLCDFCEFVAESIQYRIAESEQRLRDPLTGLFNRRYFQIALKKWASGDAKFDLILFGLNRFKRVNESLGHPAGDQILEIVANQLSEIVGENNILARVGGDEFAILALRGDHGESVLDPSVIHARLAEGFEYKGELLRCYASVGVSHFPDHGSDHSELLRYADHAMIKAKHLHVGTAWYDGALPEDAVKLLALETRIEAAIDRDEFTLAVQPIYDLTSGAATLAELEILLRWSPENIGFVSPEIFVSIAERMGLSAKLDRYVIRKALKETAHLTMPIAVNLTAPTLYADDFVDFVSFQLSQAGRLASHFGIEITERVIAQPSSARQSLEALGSLGVHIAIDDFGVGYSSLSVLPELPLSRLKIDKKFLIEKDANPRFEEVIIGILRMASALGLESLIEGVEDPATTDWLVDVGCDFAQGYGLSRPGSIDAISQSHELF